MRTLLFILISSFLFFSCKNNNDIPDVSNFSVPLKIERFDKELFNKDTNNLNQSLPQFIASHPDFGQLFLARIINADPAWSADTTSMYLKSFISAYRPVYDTAQIVFGNFEKYAAEIKQGLQFVKHYFPHYQLPARIITYIGPIDGYGDLILPDALAVALHQHLGEQYSMYQNSYVMETYPQYVTRRFSPETISVNAMKNIVDDMYHQRYDDRPLIIQMVENGKKLYLLEKLQPYKGDHLLIGYSEQQMQDAYDHEAQIWDMFIKGNYLQSTDVNIFRNYVGESPKTPELGEASPGNIGSFSGWQIVRAFMQKNASVTLDSMMRTDAETIYRESKYKPRL